MSRLLSFIRRVARKSINSKTGSSVCNFFGHPHVVHLHESGIFSNVNEIIERTRLFVENSKPFYVKWNNSPYISRCYGDNAWDYYFEQPFDIDKYSIFSPYLDSISPIMHRKDNIIVPIKNWKLMPPTDRSYAKSLIDEFIRPKKKILEKLESVFPEVDFSRVIAVHLRGRGFIQRHGDPAELRILDHPEFFKVYFDVIDKIFHENSHDKVLICSDSADAINASQLKYGDRLLTYPAQRSAFGEMHHQISQDTEYSLDKYLLGEDVIIEAYLMSRCNVFVHARSSVSNFVLCKNPSARSEYILNNLVERN